MPLRKPNKTSLAGLSRHELTRLVTDQGWSDTHARDLFKQIHRLGKAHVEEMENLRYPKRMLTWLSEQVLWGPVTWESHISQDGSTKYISTLQDGQRIETLFMPMERRDTVCLSSQVGCAMGCTFCATGAMGLKRHLQVEEILHQVRMIIRDQSIPAGRHRRLNLHFMGMGEPLHNYESVMQAFQVLTDGAGLGFPQLDIGVSTCGYLPAIQRLAREQDRPALMLSVGATDPQVRSSIMPVNRSWPLEDVLTFLESFPLRKKERIMLSYVLIKNKNDDLEQAEKLLSMTRRFPSLINLIPMNEHGASPGMQEPDESHIQTFYRFLLDHGAFCTIRRSRGRDIKGGCGQFFQKN